MNTKSPQLRTNETSHSAHFSGTAANDAPATPSRSRLTPIVLHTVDASVLSYPARLLPLLPVETTLRMWVPLAASVVAVTTSTTREESLREFGQIVFSADEWAALVVGVESERVGPDDLQLFCDAKIDDPEFVLTEDLALSGASPDAPQNLSIGEVLRRIGAQIVGLVCEEESGDSPEVANDALPSAQNNIAIAS